MEFLENTGDPEKIRNPQKIARKVDFSEPRLAFYNAPSLDTVDFSFCQERNRHIDLRKSSRHRLGLQSPGPSTEPRTPRPQKCILKSEKYHFGTPQKNGPKSLLKCRKSPFLEIKMSKKRAGLFRHFVWLLGPFFRGVQNGIFRTLQWPFGVSGFRGFVGGPGDCKAGCPWDTRQDKQESTGQCPRHSLLFTLEIWQKIAFAGTPGSPGGVQKFYGGKLFYLQLELFHLQLSFFAHSPLRRSLDALPTVSKKAPTVSEKS